MSASTGCYVITLGEIVLLQGLSSNEFNGAVATVEGIKDARVVVRLLHNRQQILVKPENLLEAGGDDSISNVGDIEDLEDCCDYDSDGVPEGVDASQSPPDPLELSQDSGVEELKQRYNDLIDSNLDSALSLRSSLKAETTHYRDYCLSDRNILVSSHPNESNNDQQKFLEICTYCNAALEQNCSNWVAYEILGDAHANNNDDMKAIEALDSQFRILSEVYPSTSSTAIVKILSNVLLKIATAKGRQRDSNGELEALLHVTKIDPKNVHVFASIGDLFLDSGDINNALQYFRNAVVIDNSWALGRFHLARALLMNNEKEMAIKELEIAVNECSSRRRDETKARAAKNFMMISSLAENVQSDQSESQVVVRALLRSVNILQSDTGEYSKNPSLQQTNMRDEDEMTAIDVDNSKLTALVYCQLGKVLENLGTTVINKSEPSSLQLSGYYDGAISAFKKSCESDPSDSSYRLALGNALRIRAHSRKSKIDLDDSIVVYQSGLLIDSGYFLSFHVSFERNYFLYRRITYLASIFICDLSLRCVICLINLPHLPHYMLFFSENAALHRNLACSQMQKGHVASAISSFTTSLQFGTQDEEGVDPWATQINSIIKDLTEKLRLQNQGTIVVDLPR